MGGIHATGGAGTVSRQHGRDGAGWEGWEGGANVPSSRPVCAEGPDVWGHGDPAPPLGAAVLGKSQEHK